MPKKTHLHSVGTTSGRSRLGEPISIIAVFCSGAIEDVPDGTPLSGVLRLVAGGLTGRPTTYADAWSPEHAALSDWARVLFLVDWACRTVLPGALHGFPRPRAAQRWLRAIRDHHTARLALDAISKEVTPALERLPTILEVADCASTSIISLLGIDEEPCLLETAYYAGMTVRSAILADPHRARSFATLTLDAVETALAIT